MGCTVLVEDVHREEGRRGIVHSFYGEYGEGSGPPNQIGRVVRSQSCLARPQEEVFLQ
jgi:hypothetical protein